MLGAAWQELRRLDEEYATRRWRVANKFVEYVSSGGLLYGPRQRGAICRLPRSTRLAVEMLVHEEQERAALEGELAALEAAWREKRSPRLPTISSCPVRQRRSSPGIVAAQGK